jgi:hypothetical protein
MGCVNVSMTPITSFSMATQRYTASKWCKLLQLLYAGFKSCDANAPARNAVSALTLRCNFCMHLRVSPRISSAHRIKLPMAALTSPRAPGSLSMLSMGHRSLCLAKLMEAQVDAVSGHFEKTYVPKSPYVGTRKNEIPATLQHPYISTPHSVHARRFQHV